MYAGDLKSFIKDERSVNHLFSLINLNDFGAYSGPKIDISKTEMRNVAWEPKMPLIGKLATFHIACPEEYAFALGVTFAYDSTTTRHKIQEKLVTLKKVLNYWRTRNLTLIGRICKLQWATKVLRHLAVKFDF